MDSSDDEDLKRAMEMSLADARRSPPPVVDLVSDDDDEDLRKAIALSLKDSNGPDDQCIPPIPREEAPLSPRSQDITAGRNSSMDEPPTSKILHNSSSNPGYVYNTPAQSQLSTQAKPESSGTRTTTNSHSGLMGFDRKAMEQERLARLGKRKRDPSPEMPSKKATEAATPAPINKGNNQKTSSQTNIQYPKGAIKRTWAHKHPRTNDMTLEEVFQGTPSIAVLSSMDWDDKWVFSKLPPQKTKQIWVMNAKGEDLQNKLYSEFLAARIPNMKPHFPPMDGNVSQMHSKLMLLFHETHLRVVVPTANMLNVHWGETNKDEKGYSWQAAVMENSLFLIDLPRRSDEKVGDKEGLTQFGRNLVDFLDAQKIGKRVTDGVLKFDFSETEKIGFVHSIPGQLTTKFENTGIPGLRAEVRRLGLDKVQTLELDYAASSMGAVNARFLQQLYQAASGSTCDTRADFLDHIRIYFPTDETVRSSTGGPDCGGVITLNRSYYNNAAFPKQCLRDYKSTRAGVLSHNKILLARGRKADGTAVAWAYVGSANLSESAWGGQKELKTGKTGKLNIRNWECGVVVAVPADAFRGLSLEDGEVPPMSVFEGVVEVPFQWPGEGYAGRKPWFFMDVV